MSYGPPGLYRLPEQFYRSYAEGLFLCLWGEELIALFGGVASRIAPKETLAGKPDSELQTV
jgi:hypothetical protein